MKNTILHANGGINSIATFFKNLQMFSGIPEAIKRANDGEKIWSAIKNSHIVRDSAGQTNYFRTGAKIAGSYMTLSAGMRILSGGGLYRDSKGNADIIGIPFI